MSQFSEGCCKLAIVDGQMNLYMPDGTMIPKQIASTVVQNMDHAINRPRMAIVRMTMYVEVVDSIEQAAQS